jgi:hypothetical protein
MDANSSSINIELYHTKKNLYDGREGYEMRLEITTLYIYILGQIDNIMGRD